MPPTNGKGNLITQPSNIFNGMPSDTSSNNKVFELLKFAQLSQEHLIAYMEFLTQHSKAKGIKAKWQSAGIKSSESALRKVKNKFKNNARLLTDPYRGSIIVNSIEGIYLLHDIILETSRNHGFNIVATHNTFKHPRNSGYRDLNYRLADMKNHGLIGELQLHLCSIIKVKNSVGHKSYEILRTLPSGSNNANTLKKQYNKWTGMMYRIMHTHKNNSCFNNSNQPINIHTAGRRTRHLHQKHHRRQKYTIKK